MYADTGLPGEHVGQHALGMVWACLGAMPPRCHLAADVGTNHLAADVGTDRSTCTWVKIYASEYIITGSYTSHPHQLTSRAVTAAQL